MKHLVAATVLTLGTSAMAQDSGFNAGLELSIPMGDFGDMFSLGYGLGLGYDSEAGNQGLLGLSVSYSGLSSKEDMFTKGSMIQLMGHYKYFFDDVREGIYVAPYLGWSMVAYRLEYSIPGVIDYSGDETAGGLAFGAGAGYVVNERIDIGVRYQIIRATEDGDATASAGEASSSLGFFGLRAGYNF